MRVLIIGGGGREHALCDVIARSPRLTRLYAAPGNVGIAQVAECVDIAASDYDGLIRFAEQEAIDLTIVGPEAPLVDGLADRFAEKGLRLFGPNARAARLEGSKAFTKDICQRYHIPTAISVTVTDADLARAHLDTVVSYPIVIKADGLAAGKGVIIVQNREEADEAILRMFENRDFGDAASQVVIEEFLEGTEASVLAIVDGKTIAMLETARDHKAAHDHDRGPNTGGMGAVSPATSVTPSVLEFVETNVLLPTVHAMAREAGGFQGFLYAGLMLTPSGPKLLEYNVRFGDPEAQAILPRLKSDLLSVLDLAVDGRLDESEPLEWDEKPACCVVLASGGYPGSYETGREIQGLEEAAKNPDVQIFHSGTSAVDGMTVTAGGRVLGVTARGGDMSEARTKAYDAVARINFEGAFYRSDIGAKDCEAVL